MKTVMAKSISYASKTRSKKEVLYIVIHNTGNKGDTAMKNALYFQNGNIRAAGAHFFIDQNGNVVKSIPMNRTAYAVGGSKYKNEGGRLYGIANNANSVSIELCDIIDREPSDEMMDAVWKTIQYIRKYCPNATEIIRHYDVNGKYCPEKMVDEAVWTGFQLRLLARALGGKS